MSLNEYTIERDIHVSLEFVRIGEIDIMNERFYAELVLKIFWDELDQTEEYDPKKHWNPKIYIENSFFKPEETITYTRVMHNGTTGVMEKRKLKGYFWERMELHDFPVDLQELSITLSSRLDKGTIKFVADDYKIADNAKFTFVEQQRWRLLELIEVTYDTSYDLGSGRSLNKSIKETEEFQAWINRPRICFKTFAIRRPHYYFENAYFLILIITFISMTVFSIDCKYPQSRLQTTATMLLTSVSFKWVINRSLPTVNYTTSLDRYSITGIVFLCSLCIWHAIIGSFWEKPIAKEIDFWALVAYGTIFLLIQFVFGLTFLRSFFKFVIAKDENVNLF